MSDFKGKGTYALSVIIYGTVGLLLRFTNLPSEIVVLCRGVIGSLFIYTYLRAKGRKLDFKAIKSNLKPLLISGVCLGLNWVFLFLAYLKTTVAIASLCNYLAPVIVVLIAPLVLREKTKPAKLLCVLGALVGVVLISNVNGETGVNVEGLIFALLAALGFVGIVICNRKLKDIMVYDRAVVQLAMSALTVLPYAIINNVGKKIELDALSVVICLILGLVHTGFAYILYFGGISTLPVHTVAVVGYLEPVVSVLSSVFILGESMGVLGWIGAALIIASALISELVN